MTPEHAAFHYLLEMLRGTSGVLLRAANLGDGCPARVDHDRREITLEETARPCQASLALLYQLARLDHGPGRDTYALRDALSRLYRDDLALSDDRVQQLATEMGVDAEAILAARNNGHPPRE